MTTTEETYFSSNAPWIYLILIFVNSSKTTNYTIILKNFKIKIINTNSNLTIK